MKNPTLEKVLQDLESEEAKRKTTVAAILSKKGHRRHTKSKKNLASRTRRQVIEDMIRSGKQKMYARNRENQRTMFGIGGRKGMLLHPDPKPELSYDRQMEIA